MPERKPTHCMTVHGFRYESTKAGDSGSLPDLWRRRVQNPDIYLGRR